MHENSQSEPVTIADRLKASPPQWFEIIAAQTRFVKAREELKTRFIGRDDLVDLVGLTLASGRNMVAFGPPGTAKSAVIRRMAQHITAGNDPLRYFSLLVFRSTVPGEAFGAVDVEMLKRSVFQYMTDGMMPWADIAFLDEVYNGTSAFLNGTMQIMNERVFKMGPLEIRVPMLSVFAAANVLPQEPDLAAFHDRFLLRTVVNYLDDAEADAMIDRDDLDDDTPPTNLISKTDLLLLQHAAKYMVTMNQVCKDALKKLRRDLRAEGIILSDRRQTQLKSLLKSQAVIAGRDHVELSDFVGLTPACWQDAPDVQIPKCDTILLRIENPLSATAQQHYDTARTIQKNFEATLARLPASDASGRADAVFDASGRLMEVYQALQELRVSAVNQGYAPARIDAFIGKVEDISVPINQRVMGAKFDKAALRASMRGV